MTAQPFKSIVLDLLQQGHLDEEAFLQELGETERSAIGTPDLWSAKDHVAHMTFWHQDLIGKVTAISQHQEIPPNEESDDQVNAMVFEEHKLHPFSALHAESERVYAELIQLIEHLSEDDLTASNRFPSLTGEKPLYAAFIGSCYEHDQEHLAQYYSDRHDLPRAIKIREKCANRVIQAEVPQWVKGSFLYNLACFYAQQNQLEKAAALLQEALTLAPRLKERSKSDPDLVAFQSVWTQTEEDTMSKEQLLQEFAEAYEQLMAAATSAAQRGITRHGDTWGPREIVAHLAGWEVMATVRIPRIVAGMPPAEFSNKTQQTVMNDAINAAMVTLMGEQSLDTLCSLLRQAYQRNVEMLRKLEDTFFQPGEYVYERTKAVIEHCQEHMQQLVLPYP